MNLLRYEFIDGPDGSINGMLRSLVEELRYNRSQVTIEEYKRAMPHLYTIEATLQRLDAEIRGPQKKHFITTQYLSEIPYLSEYIANT